MKTGAKFKTKHGNVWTVVKLNHPARGRVQVQDEKGSKFDVAQEHLRNSQRIRWYSNLFKGKSK